MKDWARDAFSSVKASFTGGHIQQPPRVLQAVFLPESTATRRTQNLPGTRQKKRWFTGLNFRARAGKG